MTSDSGHPSEAPKLIWEGDYVRGSYIAFQRIGVSETGKTMIWDVFNYDDADSSLGKVRWFGRWRTYAFHPNSNSAFEKNCLREIAQVCEQLTIDHRQRSKLHQQQDIKAGEPARWPPA